MYKRMGIGLLAMNLLAAPGFADDFQAPQLTVSSTFTDRLEIIPGGYDPVAQINDGKRLRGKLRFSYVHDGEPYVFANRTNRNRFILEPERYLNGSQ